MLTEINLIAADLALTELEGIISQELLDKISEEIMLKLAELQNNN